MESHKSHVALQLDILAALFQLPLYESKSSVCFCTDVVDVYIPLEIGCYVDAKILILTFFRV